MSPWPSAPRRVADTVFARVRLPHTEPTVVFRHHHDILRAHGFRGRDPLVCVQLSRIEARGVELMLGAIGQLVLLDAFRPVFGCRPVDHPVQKSAGAEMNEHPQLIVVPDQLLSGRQCEMGCRRVDYRRIGGEKLLRLAKCGDAQREDESRPRGQPNHAKGVDRFRSRSRNLVQQPNSPAAGHVQRGFGTGRKMHGPGYTESTNGCRSGARPCVREPLAASEGPSPVEDPQAQQPHE